MSTHRRAWQKRAGVVVALIVGALLAVPATPALAANPDVQITNLPNGTLQSGQQTSMTFRVKNNNELPTPFNISVNVFNGLSCQGDCNIPARVVGPNEEVSITVNLVAGDVAAGQERSGKVRVSARAGGDQGGDERDMTVRGPNPAPTSQAPQTVRSIAGKVVARSGDGVPNAYVLLVDSAGRQRDTTSDGNGNFRFTGNSGNPIAPGRVDIGASKDDIRATVSFTANAGQQITGRRITLAIETSASPSATPSESVSAEPTEDPFADDATDETDAPPGDAPAAQAPAGNESSGGFGNWLLILLGGLFVAIGVGTIVLLWMKRKENEDPDPDGEPVAGAPAGAVPAARGSFAGADDQTRVVNRVGSAPDPTMVGGPGLANAPTMMHQPVVDDVPPDPYGAPPQPYGAAGGSGQQAWSGGYGDEQGGGYGGGPGYGNAPSSGGGYGNAPSSGGGYGTSPSSGGGYGSRDYGAGGSGSEYPPAGAGGAAGYGERYDEPTGRYQGDDTRYPAPADPYATGVYQPEGGQGYGQPEPGGYGRGEPGGAGYGQGEPGGYGQGGDATRGYGQGDPTGGYGQGGPGGYGQGGGDTPRGYGQEDPTGGYGQGGDATRGYGRGEPTGGYGHGAEPTGGYGQGAGYGQEPPQQRGGYDNYNEPTGYAPGGYGQGGGYGQEPPQQRGGYDNAYEQGGYGQGGGYGQEPPRQRGGYDNDYEQQQQGGGYHSDPAQSGRGRPDGPGQERGGRRLDWMDD